MKIRCFLLGCHWSQPVPFRSGNETLIQQICARCGTRRTMTCE
jgi:hypothetical protein